MAVSLSSSSCSNSALLQGLKTYITGRVIALYDASDLSSSRKTGLRKTGLHGGVRNIHPYFIPHQRIFNT
jgi:hypothetical protein